MKPTARWAAALPSFVNSASAGATLEELHDLAGVLRFGAVRPQGASHAEPGRSVLWHDRPDDQGVQVSQLGTHGLPYPCATCWVATGVIAHLLRSGALEDRAKASRP